MTEAQIKAPGLVALVNVAIGLARQAEQTIHTALARLFPDDGFTGEEGGRRRDR